METVTALYLGGVISLTLFAMIAETNLKINDDDSTPVQYALGLFCLCLFWPVTIALYAVHRLAHR